MGVHPKLRGFSRVKHIKAFSKYLKGIEKDLEKLGCTDFDVEIVPWLVEVVPGKVVSRSGL